MIVIGSDPHKRSYTFSAVVAETGELRGSETVAVSSAGTCPRALLFRQGDVVRREPPEMHRDLAVSLPLAAKSPTDADNGPGDHYEQRPHRRARELCATATVQSSEVDAVREPRSSREPALWILAEAHDPPDPKAPPRGLEPDRLYELELAERAGTGAIPLSTR